MLDVAGSMGWEVWGPLAAVVLLGALLISLLLRRRRARRVRGREFEAYREALEALLSDDLPAAALALRDAAMLNSSRVSTYLTLGRIFRRLGDPERALRVHRTLLVRQEIPSSLRLDALRESALDELAANRAQEALALIDEVLAKRRKDREALAAAVQAHARLGHWAAAYEIQRRLDRITRAAHPERLARLLAAEGRQRIAQNDPAAAKKILKRAIGAHAESIDALLALGDAELASGKPERAVENWEKILRIDPGRAPALFPRVEQAFYQLGDVERLEGLLRRLITGRPYDANLHLLLGQHLAKKQRADDALGALKKAVDLDPANLAARRAWGQFRMEHGGEASLETDYQSLLEALPVSSAESVSAPRPAGPLEVMLHQDESGAWARGPAEPPAR